MTKVSLPVVTVGQASEYLAEHYGITGRLTPLNGERDLNFLVEPEQQPATISSQRYVFKIANAEESRELLEAQAEIFDLIRAREGLDTILSIRSRSGDHVGSITGRGNSVHLCRLTTYLEGELLSSIQPRSPALYQSLGAVVARTGIVMQERSTPCPERNLLWDMQQAETVIHQFLPLLTGEAKQELIRHFLERFSRDVRAVEGSLRTGLIHNDANDNNVVVADRAPWDQQVVGLIDFGDMMEGWRLTDLAIACAYAMLDQPRPLDAAAEIVRGFHAADPLTDTELRALFAMIAIRLCMSVCVSAHQQQLEPQNHYLSISEAPAWRMLNVLVAVPGRYPEFLFRSVCGMEAVPGNARIGSWLERAIATPGMVASPVSLDLSSSPLVVVDTSVSSPEVSPRDLVDQAGNFDTIAMARRIERLMEDTGASAAIGRYDEYRLIYGGEDFVDFAGHRRTLHLGVDIYQPAGSAVNAVLSGTVHSVSNHPDERDYGGTVLVAHDADGTTFHTLYGHLDPVSIKGLAAGDKVQAGQGIGAMGAATCNGGWPPHLHFEIVTNLLDYTDTFVGVGSHAHREVWLSLCPDPSRLLRIPAGISGAAKSDANRDPRPLIEQRAKMLSTALSTAYRDPLLLGRGAGQYLYDYTGRRFLDAVNNVPHVGHCHPEVAEAGARAAQVLSTNTRYLYPSLTRYASRLLEHFPASLEIVFLVNSGSEANDLALRLARRHTGRRDVIVLDHAYHGNLGSLVDMSPYKHNGKGGEGPPDWVHTVPLPDKLRAGKNMDDKTFSLNCLDVAAQVIRRANPPAAVFAEPISGCGGQVMLPEGFLAGVFAQTRAAGGVCVADEVQTGFGRTGSWFWAYEMHDVVPDIVTLGKPAGNGHPLAAVVTTRAIADSFVTGMEYFNTFGGNPVSCAIGEAVLDVMEKEQLQQNARLTGTSLMQQLSDLALTHPLIADVRGAGLFIGVELVEDRQSMKPAADQARYIAERMKQEGILISTDGPWHNVLKIKPPMVFDRDDATFLTDKLGTILNEKWALPRPSSDLT